MESRTLSALVVGAISRDLQAGSTAGSGTSGAGASGSVHPGGVVYWAGVTFARLDTRVRVVTRVHPDHAAELLGPMDAEGIETLALESRETTTCSNDYSGPVDLHELCAVSDTIEPDDVPESWRDADVVQLGPLHRDDVAPETAAVFRGLVGLDVQGLVRERTARGTRLAPNPKLARYLAHVDVLKIGEAELAPVLEGADIERFRRGHVIRELIVTRGVRGASVLTDSGAHQIPADPTSGHALIGAGDVFFASYLSQRGRGRGPLEAARFAARITAEKIAHGHVPKGLRSSQ